MDNVSSLSYSQLSVDTYRSDICQLPPIISRPMVWWNGCTRRLSLVSTITRPSIRPIGISLFRPWRTPTTCECIFQQGHLHSVWFCLVSRRFLPCWIHHRRCWSIYRHHLSPAYFAGTFCENLPHSEHLLTEHWKTLKLVTKATSTSRFTLPQRSYRANTYYSIACLTSLFQPPV